MINPESPAQTESFAKQDVAQTLIQLETSAETGLNQQQAQQRLAAFGPNEIEEHEESLLSRLLRRFWGPIPWMIEIAALLSALVQKWEDLIIILVMLLVNALLDFYQEHRALNALAALKQGLAQEVTVLREGKYQIIPSRELVPGDVLRLRIGDVLPADVQLLEGDYLSIDQSALTGESLPVTLRKEELAYANTIIKQGEMLAVVVNTAANTRFHSVVALVARASLQERSHFQKMVMQIGNFLIILTVIMVALIFMVALFRHEDMLEIARFAMVLTVAAIPVALPAVLSVTMAVGAINLARKKAIVSRLTAIEELAGVDVFCSDKTGTLTKNEMQVAEPVIFNGHAEQDLFLTAVLASRRENHDPIETPLFHHMDQLDRQWEQRGYRQKTFTPFDPVSKYTSAEIEFEGRSLRVFKGAAQVLLDKVDLPDNEVIAIVNSVDLLAGKGYRTLAVGREYPDEGFQLMGLIPLIDPPREDSAEVIRTLRDYGVQLKMVTGDNIAIAREIGEMLGLTERAVRAEQLTGKSGNEFLALTRALTHAIYHKLNPEVTRKQAQSFADEVMADLDQIFDTSLLEKEFIHTHESALLEMIESVDIFAEVLPEDKYNIVNTLQKAGHIVGMTGDGVNDAPALKKADCGFAVSNATDAARAAADIVLTAPGLSVINHAIEQARITFERMKSYATFRIAETIRIILFMTLSIVVFDFYPITALMIILLALLNDIPILAIAYDNTRVLHQPVRWNMKELLTVSSVLGVSGVVSSFLLFFLLREQGLDAGVIQTLIFLKLIIAGHSTIYVTRAEGGFWQRPWPSPLLLLATIGTEIVGTLIAVYGVFVSPIGWQYALYIWAYALVWFLFNDMVKLGTYRLLRRFSAEPVVS